MSLHENYDKLSTSEKDHVDNLIWNLRNTAKHNGMKLANDDRAERFVEALATYIQESKMPY